MWNIPTTETHHLENRAGTCFDYYRLVDGQWVKITGGEYVSAMTLSVDGVYIIHRYEGMIPTWVPND